MTQEKVVPELSKVQVWMIFRTDNFVYYIWNGFFPALIYLPPGTNPDPYYWTGMPARQLLPEEASKLTEVCGVYTKAGKKFTLKTRPGQTFIVVKHGEFPIK